MTIESGPAAARIQYANAISTGDWTACMWAKSVTPNNDFNGYITGGNFYGIWKNSGSNTQLILLANSGQSNLINLVDDEWFFIALVHDDSEADELIAYGRLAGDTSLTASGRISADVAAGDDLFFMRSPFGEGVAGDYGIIKMWTRALTSDELMRESRKIAPVDPTNTFAWLPCLSSTDTDDGTNTGSMRDYSGNGNHGPPDTGSFADIDDVTGNNIPMVPWGTSGLLVPPTAAVPPAGAISATLDQTLTITGALTGDGALASALSAALILAAPVAGQGAVTSALSAALALTAPVAAQGAVDSALSAALTLTPTVTSQGGIAAQLDQVAAIAVALTADGTLEPTLAQVLTVAADLQTPAVGLSAQLTQALLVVAALGGADTLSSVLAQELTATAALDGQGALSSSMALQATLVAALADALAVTLPNSTQAVIASILNTDTQLLSTLLNSEQIRRGN